MKKIFLVIVLAVLATTAAEAQLQNTVFKAKVFISDNKLPLVNTIQKYLAILYLIEK